MDRQNDPTSSFLDTLAGIRTQFFQQKEQAVRLTEEMIRRRDLSYIPQILALFPVGPYQLHQLDADMRRLLIICEIVAAEEKLPGGRLVFLENTASFDDLIRKYIYITFLLRRIELRLPDDALRETADALSGGGISVCALRKITECEIFTDPGYVCQQALKYM